MKSFAKSSFFVVFGVIFSTTMIVLGGLQAYFGVVRLYDPVEEKYESTQSEEVYAVNPVEKNIFYFASSIEGKKQKDALAYLDQNSATLENVLRSVPPQKAEKILRRIQELQQQTNPSTQQIPSSSVTPVKTPEAQTVTQPVKQSEPVKEVITPFVSPILFQIIPETAKAPKGYQNMVYTVAEGPFFRDTLWDFPIIVDTKRVSPRGQVYNETLTLSSTMSSVTEAGKVLVHELGHMIDIYYLQGSKKVADPSIRFYEISWKEPTVMKSSASARDFISGYAATNQYEDFAEAFAFYVFHNTEFERRAQTIPALQKKFDFFHNNIFGDTFLGNAYEKNAIPDTFWDVTKIVINTSNLSDIFASISRIFRVL